MPALLLRDGNDISFCESGNRLTLEIPRSRPGDVDTAIGLTLAK